MAITDFLSTPGGATTTSALLNFFGGLLSGQGEAKQAQQNAGLQNAQFTANQQMQRDTTGVGLLDPSKIQNWRQKQATLAAIMPGLRNASVKAPAGMQAYMPKLSGGFKLPEGGFGPETLSFFSPESRAAAEGSFWGAAAPFVNPPDLTKVGYGAVGQEATTAAQEARRAALAKQAQAEAARNALIGQGGGGFGSALKTAATGLGMGALANQASGGKLTDLLKTLFGGDGSDSTRVPGHDPSQPWTPGADAGAVPGYGYDPVHDTFTDQPWAPWNEPNWPTGFEQEYLPGGPDYSNLDPTGSQPSPDIYNTPPPGGAPMDPYGPFNPYWFW